MLEILDIFFLVFHSLVVVFNLFGWIPKLTRRLNFITLLITGASWFILGIFYRIGYCPLTDWHFKVLIRLGYNNLPNSYIKYIIDRITGLNLNANLVDFFTVFAFFVALIISGYLNIKGFKKAKKN